MLKLGAGPYSKLRLILERGTVHRTAKSATFIDPLTLAYLKNTPTIASYPTTQCLNESTKFKGGFINLLLGNFSLVPKKWFIAKNHLLL